MFGIRCLAPSNLTHLLVLKVLLNVHNFSVIIVTDVRYNLGAAISAPVALLSSSTVIQIYVFVAALRKNGIKFKSYTNQSKKLDFSTNLR